MLSAGLQASGRPLDPAAAGAQHQQQKPVPNGVRVQKEWGFAGFTMPSFPSFSPLLATNSKPTTTYAKSSLTGLPFVMSFADQMAGGLPVVRAGAWPGAACMPRSSDGQSRCRQQCNGLCQSRALLTQRTPDNACFPAGSVAAPKKPGRSHNQPARTATSCDQPAASASCSGCAASTPASACSCAQHSMQHHRQVCWRGPQLRQRNAYQPPCLHCRLQV